MEVQMQVQLNREQLGETHKLIVAAFAIHLNGEAINKMLSEYPAEEVAQHVSAMRKLRDDYAKQHGGHDVNVTEKHLLHNAIKGCSVGDALGNTFEFGYPSPKEFSRYYDSDTHMEITDDTQMSLFTLEGMVQAMKTQDTGAAGVVQHISDSYLVWYKMQMGWHDNTHVSPCRLQRYKELGEQRVPGVTCLHSLNILFRTGKVPPNDRKGAGANMRMLPLAFLNLLGIGLKSTAAQSIAVGSALITHKHPLLKQLMPIQQRLMANVKGYPDFKDAMRKTFAEEPAPAWLMSAIARADTTEGWVAEEALGVAIAANLKFDTFKDMMAYCVCRQGDSDTIGAIAGGLWGLSGKEIPPQLWHRVRESLLIEEYLDWVNAELRVK